MSGYHKKSKKSKNFGHTCFLRWGFRLTDAQPLLCLQKDSKHTIVSSLELF